MRTLKEHVPAPGELGVALIGVQEGSDVGLDLRLEAVHEGILVSGTVAVHVTGECGRCLDPLAYDQEVDVQELFFYEDAVFSDEEEEEEQYRIEHDLIDLEPVLRDAVVTMLPFQPVCREDCQGLCSECGVRLEDEPGHHHEVVDPRWAALADLAKPDRQN
ncbi:YceD family protein [Pseudarthrobacter sp. H2]|uniref:YceD family protein n=1 Tax=Pseudarthrobacter sp. H2 TaxID=3418415 RepID=UPI003CF3B765